MAASRALLIGALSLIVLLGAPRRADALRAIPPFIPDPLTAADSSRGAALALCTQGNRLDSPAHFTILRRLGGALPDSFTTYPRTDGFHEANAFRAGEHYALLLRPAAPPIGPEFRKAFPWRAPADFEAWYADRTNGPPPAGLPDSLAARLYASIWAAVGAPRAAQAESVAVWLRSGMAARRWAFAAVARHPDLVANGPVRAYYLAELAHATDTYRESLARAVALFPDTASRALLATLARGEASGPETAVQLGAHDRTPWVRQLILSIAAKTLEETPWWRDWRR